MPPATTVPSFSPIARALIALVALGALLLVPRSALARGPEPPLRIALVQIGFPAAPPNALAGSASLTTVHFVDEQHLLVTFNVRHLMKRLPDCPPEDIDRTVEAVLVRLPQGELIARTHWRVHDPGQYLWPLGHGRFLLRVRDTLTTISPLANSAKGEAFEEQPFLSSRRKIAAILLSAENDLATVQTTEQPERSETGELVPSAERRRMQINFYRVLEPEQPGQKVIVQSAGIASSLGAVNLPLTSAGYLEILKESPTRWLFDFNGYTGSHLELSPFDTTCQPQPTFVSASEFVALGCRGSSDRLSIGGFNMRGEQVWQQDFLDPHAFPNYAFAPRAGRFALSRNIVSSNAGITADFAPSAFTTQEIRIYQSYNGKQLLRAEASPVQRTGENYDLSPEGLHFAVVHSDAIEVYKLPGLSKSDEAAIQASRALAPKQIQAAVNLAARTGSRPVEKKPVEAETPKVKTVVAEVPVVGPEKQVAPQPVTVGDVQPETPRKSPTLYTLPTDKPTERPQP